jgi:hypothetical protein
MQRYREGRYSQYDDHDNDSAMSPYDQYDIGAAQETDSFYSARETLNDNDDYESEYPMQDYIEEPTFTQYNKLNEISDRKNLSHLKRPSQRQDVYPERAAYHAQQTAQTSAKMNRSSRGSAEEGPSSLQTRLNSFAVPRRRRVDASPPSEDHSMHEPLHTVEDSNLPSSPSPNNALNAQPSNLAPVTLPVRLEFTAPADFVAMDLIRGSNGQDTGITDKSELLIY